MICLISLDSEGAFALLEPIILTTLEAEDICTFDLLLAGPPGVAPTTDDLQAISSFE